MNIIELVLKEANIKKQSDMITDISRILNLNLDDVLVNKGYKVIDLLDKIEVSKDSTLIEKQDLVGIKDKIKKSMESFQEAMEDLFSLHERLVREQEMQQGEVKSNLLDSSL
jgi:hypothetical protein